MLDLESTWEFVAGQPSRRASQNAGLIQVYRLSADKLKSLCDEDPSFRSFVVTRAVSRRAYWLRMLNEVRHRRELESKRIRDDRPPEFWRRIATIGSEEREDAKMLGLEFDESPASKEEIGEHKLEYKLRKSVQMLISREENRKKAAGSKADPQTLASRVQSLDQGLHDLSESEYMKRFGVESTAAIVRILDKFELVVQFKGLYTFALVFTTL